MGNLEFTLCICTLNRPSSLKESLDSYFTDVDLIPTQLVVVDQSFPEIAAQNRQNIKEYENKTNLIYLHIDAPSLTKARNEAIKKASKDLVIFSDDDVIVKKESLLHIKDIMEDSKVSMIAGLDELSHPSHSVISYLLGTKSFAKRHNGHITNSMLGRFPDSWEGEHETEWAMGFFFIVRLELLKKWNLWFDEQLTGYAYAEDLDFTYSYYKKSKEEGFHCITSDQVIVQHLATKEYRIPSRKNTFMFIINRTYLFYKHNNEKSIIPLYWCNFCYLIHSIVKGTNYIDFRDAIRKNRLVKNELKEKVLYEEFYEM